MCAEPAAVEPAPIVVGSKQFTESVILGEIVRLSGAAHGLPARHQRELGGTRILFAALERGDIAIYPEYTGTIAREILAAEHVDDVDHMRAALAARGIVMSAPLGFE